MSQRVVNSPGGAIATGKGNVSKDLNFKDFMKIYEKSLKTERSARAALKKYNARNKVAEQLKDAQADLQKLQILLNAVERIRARPAAMEQMEAVWDALEIESSNPADENMFSAVKENSYIVDKWFSYMRDDIGEYLKTLNVSTIAELPAELQSRIAAKRDALLKDHQTKSSAEESYGDKAEIVSLMAHKVEKAKADFELAIVESRNVPPEEVAAIRAQLKGSLAAHQEALFKLYQDRKDAGRSSDVDTIAANLKAEELADLQELNASLHAAAGVALPPVKMGATIEALARDSNMERVIGAALRENPGAKEDQLAALIYNVRKRRANNSLGGNVAAATGPTYGDQLDTRAEQAVAEYDAWVAAGNPVKERMHATIVGLWVNGNQGKWVNRDPKGTGTSWSTISKAGRVYTVEKSGNKWKLYSTNDPGGSVSTDPDVRAQELEGTFPSFRIGSSKSGALSSIEYFVAGDTPFANTLLESGRPITKTDNAVTVNKTRSEAAAVRNKSGITGHGLFSVVNDYYTYNEQDAADYTAFEAHKATLRELEARLNSGGRITPEESEALRVGIRQYISRRQKFIAPPSTAGRVKAIEAATLASMEAHVAEVDAAINAEPVLGAPAYQEAYLEGIKNALAKMKSRPVPVRSYSRSDINMWLNSAEVLAEANAEMQYQDAWALAVEAGTASPDKPLPYHRYLAMLNEQAAIERATKQELADRLAESREAAYQEREGTRHLREHLQLAATHAQKILDAAVAASKNPSNDKKVKAAAKEFGAAVMAYRNLPRYSIAYDPVVNPTSVASATAALRAYIPAGAQKRVTIVQSLADVSAYIAKHGISLKAEAKAFTHKGNIWLIADNIEAGTEAGVLMHEAGVHLNMSKAQIAAFSREIQRMADAGDTLAIDALLSVKAANSGLADGVAEQHDIDHEAVAYFVENAVNSGIDPTKMGTVPGKMRRFFRNLLTFVRSLMRAKGLSFKALTAQDIVDAAYGAADTVFRLPTSDSAVRLSEGNRLAATTKAANP